jgi:tetratricopeptide (TPR) repeat protein
MDYKMAFRAIKRCQQMRQATYGEGNIPLAESYYLQGRLECDKGDYNLSEESLLRAQEIMLRVDGVNSIAVARVKDSLGRLYTLLSRYEDARRCLNEALTIRRELLASADEMEKKDSDRESRGAEEKEEKEEDKAETDQDSQSSEGCESADTYTLLAELNLTQHNWSEAEVHCLKSIEIYRTYYEPNHPKLLNAQGNLGLIYLLGKKKCNEGRDYLLEGERLVDEALQKLLYQSDADRRLPDPSPTYHSQHHPWIKKFQLRYCLPANLSSPPLSPSHHAPSSSSSSALSDQAIESNLLFENYQLRSKNDELQRLLTGLQAQRQSLQERLENSEEMNRTSQEIVRSLRSTGQSMGKSPLNKPSTEAKGPRGDAAVGAEDDNSDYFPKIGTIAKSLGLVKRTFTQKKYLSPR